jgi:uncharacterized membrane protein HdeD (DUF308 family)
LGVAMIIHGWGNFTAADIITDIVGFALVIAGLFSFIIYFRHNPDRHTDKE